MHSANPHFRSDIEGMRAIAILLVIGAHFAIPGFAAGFIGVDIFFVLSGFLITGILVREYQKNQRINLPRFYANRFRRLFPALATMLLVSSFVAAQILPDTQNLTQSKAAAMSAVWLSNIHFTFADVDYFAAETSSNAFLHTWSLGVEEQFYLLWPLIILTTMTLFARQQHSKPLWVALWLITGVSLLACLYLSSTQPLVCFLHDADPRLAVCRCRDDCSAVAAGCHAADWSCYYLSWALCLVAYAGNLRLIVGR